MMNREQMQGNWKQLKGEIQKQWGKLTDDELDVVEGNQTKLAGIIQERYGIAKEEAERQVRDFQSRYDA